MRPDSTSTSRLAAGAAVAVAAIVAAAATLYLSAPPAVPLVEDEASVLTAGQRSRIAEFHDFLLRDHGIDYRIFTTRNAGNINTAAVEKFAELSAAMRSESGRALLLVIDVDQDQVRMEVSHSLEPVYTDAFTKYVETRQMIEFFRTGRIADGILATTELIVAKAQDAEDRNSLDDAAQTTKSSGGGATTSAHIGKEGARTGSRQTDIAPGNAPHETLRRYLAAMAERNGAPDLALYTPDTRAMLAQWTITPAQMDMVVKSYRECTAEPARVRGQLAVIRFPIGQRKCAPFFFRQSAKGWQLDLTMMQKAIRFGRSNAWHLDTSVRHPYEFAFSDWIFDAHGFPSQAR